jgi:hypothetical protein
MYESIDSIPPISSFAAVSSLGNPVGGNLPGFSTFFYEDMLLTQDVIPVSYGFQPATSPGVIASAPCPLSTSGWPTQDFGIYLHFSNNNPSWQNGAAFACGFVSNGGGAEVITALGGCTISNINRSAAPTVTFDLTYTSGQQYGFTITSTTNGVASLWAYAPPFRSSAVNQHVDITVANVLAGEPIFNPTVTAFLSQFRRLRCMWPQNAWFNTGSINVSFASPPAAGATSGSLASNNISPGTYLCVFQPSVFESVPDVRSITFATAGQTSVSWTTGLTFAANSISLPSTASLAHTAANTKTHGSWTGVSWVNGWNIEGYPAQWMRALTVASNTSPYLHLPINDDGTYFPAFLQALQSELQPNQIADIELANENWNGTGASASVTSALVANSGLSEAAWYGNFLHAIAVQGRAIFGSKWNSQVRLHFAWQVGGNGPFFFNQVLSYMVSQGWSPAADLWCLSVAPYLNPNPAIPTGGTDTVAGIESSLTNGGYFPLFNSGAGNQNGRLETCLAVSKWYGLPGGVECYEQGWDANGLWQANTSYLNLGNAIMDPGMTAVMENDYRTLLDSGVSAWQQFEVGVSDDNSLASPLDELHNNYAAFFANGSQGTSPRMAALQAMMKGLYVPERNVISKSGDTIDWRNYLDSNTANAFPTFSGSSNISPINQYSIGMHVFVPVASKMTLLTYFTTSSSGIVNFYVDGNLVTAGVSIPSGLNGQASPPVTLGTYSFAPGHHYIELGNGTFPGTITANLLRVQ